MLIIFNLTDKLLYCDDHSSLSSTSAVQYEFHIYLLSLNQKLNIFLKYKNYIYSSSFLSDLI